MSTKKYRPYFTLSELRILQEVLTTKPSSSLFRYITKYIRDIEDGFRSSNHTLQPTIEEKLGFTDSETDTTDSENHDTALADAEMKLFNL